MPQHLSPSRLEAFSDGVIAVIITIMVLELKVPSTHDANNVAAVHLDLKLVLIYLLSFVQTGIYWVNHHYLIDDVEQVSHGLLWSNLAFLFSLSLIPFATNWIGVRGIAPFAIALYASCCAFPALSWIVLSTLICRRTGKPLAGSPAKQLVSAALYLGAIPMAYLSPLTAIAMIVLVAILWLLPPRRIVEIIPSPAASSPSAGHSR
jgi:uncharacterized membrane protein